MKMKRRPMVVEVLLSHDGSPLWLQHLLVILRLNLHSLFVMIHRAPDHLQRSVVDLP